MSHVVDPGRKMEWYPDVACLWCTMSAGSEAEFPRVSWIKHTIVMPVYVRLEKGKHHAKWE